MNSALFLFLMASVFRFDIVDGRGKKPAGVSVETGACDADGWCDLRLVNKSKGDYLLVWPYDGRAKIPDGPEGIPVIVLERSGPKNGKVQTALAVAGLLGEKPAMEPDLRSLENSDDPLAKGVALLSAGKFADAVDPLARALRERERQLTRNPSEIYPAAMLSGKALFGAGKFDDAALAFLKAIKQRPSDAAARQARAEALIRAGKPEAANTIP